ncbi:Hypothetical protein GbCGDNIH9_5010 [Granulibacter bethesdensis]|uniref:Uncharacterized protein n=1 Tax=Granulibacter bethesdensis TaxID=364410 RepID=A0AAC9P7H9_9PROT|nr:Hypothetical protein GbCGDNIH9_5010 [Granulibacter bethesdensis]APH61085.1 Hypothetical protein GbCGDNIH8_5010 [Granulibacter bethesdensis]
MIASCSGRVFAPCWFRQRDCQRRDHARRQIVQIVSRMHGANRRAGFILDSERTRAAATHYVALGKPPGLAPVTAAAPSFLDRRIETPDCVAIFGTD